MSIERIRLVSQVRKCIINLHITYSKSRTDTGLKYPNLGSVCCIAVVQSLLEIIDTSPYKKCIVIAELKAQLRIDAYRVCADQCITATIKRKSEIGLSLQINFLVDPEIV